MRQTMRSILYGILTDDKRTKELAEAVEGDQVDFTAAKEVFTKEAAKRNEYIILDDTNKEAYFSKQRPQPSLEDTLDNFNLIL